MLTSKMSRSAFDSFHHAGGDGFARSGCDGTGGGGSCGGFDRDLTDMSATSVREDAKERAATPAVSFNASAGPRSLIPEFSE